MKECIEKIDIVITWVDGSDPFWLSEKAKYSNKVIDNNSFVGGSNRYQDQGFLKYWFRGIEKFAPWVNKIHFVTFGHLPNWLDTRNPKLNIVKHTDFIPEKYLPTFNSNSILLNLFRIPGLSEKFIYFNDDMYLLKPCDSDVFFKKSLPCDMAVLNPVVAPDTDPFWDMMLNNVMIINKNFSKKTAMRKNFCKWYSFKYSFKNLIRNFSLSGFNKFPGFYDNHLPNAFLKSTFEEVWNKNEEICDETCSHKFRTENDITEWTMKYWQLAKGDFYPINKSKLGLYVSLKNHSADILLKNYKYKMICLNDETENTGKFMEFFESILPTKSSFEK